MPADGQWRYFLAGALAASLSHAAATPADVVKTRLQTRPESYDGTADAIAKIVREEGAGALFTGFGTTLTGFFVHGFFKFGLYETCKPHVAAALSALATQADAAVAVAAGSGAAAAASEAASEAAAAAAAVTATSTGNEIVSAAARSAVAAATAAAAVMPEIASSVTSSATDAAATAGAVSSAAASAATASGGGAGTLTVWLVSAFLAELVASTALCPFEATRIRIVARPGFARGLFDGMPRVVREEGAKALFYGLPAIMALKIPYTTTQLAVYEDITSALYRLLEANPLWAGGWGDGAGGMTPPVGPPPVGVELAVSAASGVISGLLACVMSQPGDSLMSAINREPIDGPVLPAITRRAKEIGLRGLFRGVGARLVHVTSIIAVQLVIYDFAKQLVGIPVTGQHG